MKTISRLAILLIASVMISSCTKHEVDKPLKTPKLEKVEASISVDIIDWSEGEGCGLMEADLIAGQTNLVGTVAFKQLNGELLVKYEVDNACLITETHLFSGQYADIEFANEDIPKIGHFPYSWEEEGTSNVVIMAIDLDEINLDENGCFDIFAHAVVDCGEGFEEETAWGKPYSSEKVFALKSLMDGSGGTEQGWMLDGAIIYRSINDAIGQSIDIVAYSDLTTVVGQVKVEKDGDILRFTITSNSGMVYWTHFFAGSMDGLLATGIWNHWGYPDTEGDDDDVGDSEHIFEFDASQFFNESPDTGFTGPRWGWYIPGYCLGGC